jgi:hypothetical protein
MVLGVVVHRGVGKQPVLAVKQRSPGLVQYFGPAALRQDQPGAGEHAEDDHDGGGQQPLEEVQPVRRQREGTSGLGLPDEGQGEEERGNEQEDVHAAGYPAQPYVVGHHHQDGQGAESLDLGPEGGCPGLAGWRLFLVLPFHHLGSLLSHPVHPVADRNSFSK